MPVAPARSQNGAQFFLRMDPDAVLLTPWVNQLVLHLSEFVATWTPLLLSLIVDCVCIPASFSPSLMGVVGPTVLDSNGQFLYLQESKPKSSLFGLEFFPSHSCQYLFSAAISSCRPQVRGLALVDGRWPFSSDNVCDSS